MPENTIFMVKHHHFDFFIKPKGMTTYANPKKFTGFTINMNPESRTTEYLQDEGPTTVIDKFQPGYDAPMDIYKGEEGYEALYPYFFQMKTGDEATADVILVYKFEKLAEATYAAWNHVATVSPASIDAYAGSLTAEISANGTIKKGYVTFTDGQPVFTEGEYPVTPAPTTLSEEDYNV